jgi:hypothetical protein
MRLSDGNPCQTFLVLLIFISFLDGNHVGYVLVAPVTNRTWRRLQVYDVPVGEIGMLEPDAYANPHSR